MIRTIIRSAFSAVYLVGYVVLALMVVLVRCHNPPATPFNKARRYILDDNIAALRTILSSNNALVRLTDSWDKSSLLHTACISCKNEETVRVLLDAGANPNALDDHGQSPMHYIFLRDPNGNSSQTQPFAKLLLEHGASLSIKDTYGKEPIDYLDRKAWSAIFDAIGE